MSEANPTSDAVAGLRGASVRWGVLSTAMIAVTRTIPAMALAPSATMVAIASRQRAQAQCAARELSVPRAHGSYDDLLADPEIDAVYVPLPTNCILRWQRGEMGRGSTVCSRN